MRRLVLLAILAACLLSLSACDDNSPMSAEFEGYFEPDVSEPGPNSISMQANGEAGKRFKIDIVATEITLDSVYAAAFDVDFRPVILEYQGFEQGDFFEQSGGSVVYQVATEEGNPGRVIVGISLTGDLEGVTGSGTLITLEFKALAEDLTPMTYGEHQLLDGTPPSGNPITGISWYAGRVTVV